MEKIVIRFLDRKTTRLAAVAYNIHALYTTYTYYIIWNRDGVQRFFAECAVYARAPTFAYIYIYVHVGGIYTPEW